MDQESHYRKLQNASHTEINQVGSIPDVPSQTTTSPPTPDVDRKLRRSKVLVIVQLILSVTILIVGMTATGFGSKLWFRPYTELCVKGTTIWVPVLGIVTSGLGLGALKYGNYSTKCLPVAHFVMCIISAVASAVLMIRACVCLFWSSDLSRNSWSYDECVRRGYYGCIPPGLVKTLVSCEALILVGALTHCK